MSVRVHAVVLLTLVAGLACVRQSNRLADPSVAASGEAARTVAGTYRLVGRIQGIDVNTAVRVDSAGRLSYLAGTPAAALPCESHGASAGRLVGKCGSVDVQFDVAAGVIAREARIAFDSPRPPRREFDPFTCVQMPPDNQGCTLPGDTRTSQVRRVAGKVSVTRLSE